MSRVLFCVRADAFDEDHDDDDVDYEEEEEEEKKKKKKKKTCDGHCAVSRLERGRVVSQIRAFTRAQHARPGEVRVLGTLNPGPTSSSSSSSPSSSLSQATEPVVSPQGVSADLTHSARYK